MCTSIFLGKEFDLLNVSQFDFKMAINFWKTSVVSREYTCLTKIITRHKINIVFFNIENNMCFCKVAKNSNKMGYTKCG